MVTREQRLSQFSQDVPPKNVAVEVLCEDHNGTYLLPFLCIFGENGWINSVEGRVIERDVLGWRLRAGI